MAIKMTLVVLAMTSLSAGQRYDGGDSREDAQPYSFSWAAARHYNGAPDREHREERGEDGVVRGVFRYVDPSLNIQEVIYTADEDGFHVENDILPKHTQAQQKEIEKHARLFQEIADEHAAIGEDHAHQAGLDPQEPTEYVAPLARVTYNEGPTAEHTPVVLRARAQHASLFERIAAQHARIAAERKTPIPEETGGPYQYAYETELKDVAAQVGTAADVLSAAPRVEAPGPGHPDFQGYGVTLNNNPIQLTEEEALELLEKGNAEHLRHFEAEADHHEALVTMNMPLEADALQRLGEANRQRDQGTPTNLGHRSDARQKSTGHSHQTESNNQIGSHGQSGSSSQQRFFQSGMRQGINKIHQTGQNSGYKNSKKGSSHSKHGGSSQTVGHSQHGGSRQGSSLSNQGISGQGVTNSNHGGSSQGNSNSKHDSSSQSVGHSSHAGSRQGSSNNKKFSTRQTSGSNQRFNNGGNSGHGSNSNKKFSTGQASGSNQRFNNGANSRHQSNNNQKFSTGRASGSNQRFNNAANSRHQRNNNQKFSTGQAGGSSQRFNNGANSRHQSNNNQKFSTGQASGINQSFNNGANNRQQTNNNQKFSNGNNDQQAYDEQLAILEKQRQQHMQQFQQIAKDHHTIGKFVTTEW